MLLGASDCFWLLLNASRRSWERILRFCVCVYLRLCRSLRLCVCLCVYVRAAVPSSVSSLACVFCLCVCLCGCPCMRASICIWGNVSVCQLHAMFAYLLRHMHTSIDVYVGVFAHACEHTSLCIMCACLRVFLWAYHMWASCERWYMPL